MSQKTPLTGFRYTGYSMKQAARACITFLFFFLLREWLRGAILKRKRDTPQSGCTLGLPHLGKKLADSKRRGKERY